MARWSGVVQRSCSQRKFYCGVKVKKLSMGMVSGRKTLTKLILSQKNGIFISVPLCTFTAKKISKSILLIFNFFNLLLYLLYITEIKTARYATLFPTPEVSFYLKHNVIKLSHQSEKQIPTVFFHLKLTRKQNYFLLSLSYCIAQM